MPDLTLAEIAQHNKEGDLWVIIGRNVYDISNFLKKHPGGPAPLRYAGQDATKIFEQVHRAGTLEKVGSQFMIGDLAWQDASLADEVEVESDNEDSEEGETWRTSEDASAPLGTFFRPLSAVAEDKVRPPRKRVGEGYDVKRDEDGYDTRKAGESDRQFGDKMAAEGELSHISSFPTVLIRLLLAGSALYLWSLAHYDEPVDLASIDAWDTLDKFHTLDVASEQDAHTKIDLLRAELDGFVIRFEAQLQEIRVLEQNMTGAREKTAAAHGQSEPQSGGREQVPKQDSELEARSVSHERDDAPPISNGAGVPASSSSVQDPGHAFFSGLRSWLLADNGNRAVVACTASSLLSELIACTIIFISCAGPTFRPMLSVILVFFLKAALQLSGVALTVIPAPGAAAGWPLLAGCPSLFSIRGAEANAFFSSRVALCGVACGELLSHTLFQHNHWGVKQKASLATRAAAAVTAAAILATQVSLSLALRVSWTVDVLVALAFARFCSMVANGLAHHVDAYMPHS